MPANLTPQYLEAEQKYREAKTPQDKMRALREMFALVPKHKGTEKLQADIKRRISKLADEMEQTRRAGHRHTDYIPKEGAGQVVLLGPPNSGRSSLIGLLTHATPEVAPYPFTTKKPLPAMMPYKDIQIQLIDMPPITESYYEGWFSNIIRDCDLALLVVGVDDLDPDGSTGAVLDHLRKSGIGLTGAANADAETADDRFTSKQCILVLNKVDLGGADIAAALLKPVIGDIPVFRTSCESGEGIDALRELLFESLSIVRVYTKAPGKKPDMAKPFVVKRGTTVLEVAAVIHKDFHDNLKFARVWGHAKFDGQPVEKSYMVQDGDIVEIHI